ncbi:MAG: hypothetical protein AAFZ65_17530 [Planctomycetota bacterium]
MRTKTLLTLSLLVAGGAAAVFATSNQGAEREVLPPLAETPQTTPIQLLEAHPFELVQPEQGTMRVDAPTYSSGWLLVLATDPDRLVPRQTEEQVLFVGDQPVRRFNNGDLSGRVVVAVEGELDLESAPIFFGEPALPERLSAADRAAQRSLAESRGARPLVAEMVAPEVVLADGYELGRYASHLIEAHSPLEVDVITGLRAERIYFR